MSSFIEKYATHLGVKPRRPHVSSHFYPVEYDKYITIDPSQSSSPNSYKNWEFVVSQIKKFAPDYNFIQVSLDKKTVIKGVDKKLRETSTLKHSLYVIKGASLHIGIDCIAPHISAHYKVPTVCLYSKYPSGHTKPIYADDSIFKIIEVDRSESKPTYLENGSADPINKIPPEAIISKALDLLGIPHSFQKYETVNIGHHFPSEVLEIVPDHPPQENASFDKIVNLRFDYTKNRSYSKDWLKHKCNILTDSPVDLSLISENRENIRGFTLFIDEDSFSEEYLKSLKKLNVPIRFTCKDLDKIDEIRLKFFDWPISKYEIQDEKKLDFYDDLCENTFYYSNKILVSENKKYSSKAAWEKGIELKDDKPEKIIDSAFFWEEFEHFNIYKHGQKKGRNSK